MTVSSDDSRVKRLRKLKGRIQSDEYDYLLFCSITDPLNGKPCGRPTSRAARKGLSRFVCRYHQQFQQRHGSPWKRSPSARDLQPYLHAALRFLTEHRSDPFVSAGLCALGSFMASAGPVEIATRLRGLLPAQRAEIALARLRRASIKPERLLAIVLAVHALIEDAPEKCHRVRDWRIVAIAKAAHRLASGTHRVWSVPQPDGRTKHIEMHAYPRSSGRVLRHLGEMIETPCEPAIARNLGAVIALKRNADGAVSDSGGPKGSSD